MSFIVDAQKSSQKIIAGTVLTSLLWTSFPFFPSDAPFSPIANNIVHAKEMASGSGSRVNKDPESLLRYGLPIKNKEVREVQGVIETIRNDIASKRKSAGLDGVKKSRSILNKKAKNIVAACNSADECTSIVNSMIANLDPLEVSLKASSDFLQGSEQEKEALTNAFAAQDTLQKQLTELETAMVPPNYKTPVPGLYSDLPQLQGRATIEFLLKKPGNAPFDIEGVNFPEAKLKMIIDGYAAPVTAGNFIELVQKGFYDKMAIQRSDGFVVQTGDPEGVAVGYVGKASKSIGAGKNGERLIPSEIFVKGDKAPFYESTIEDEGRGGEATVLPFSSYGAMGWAREEYDANSGSSQFFWLLFDSDLTPAGKNVIDGRYPCFGYVVEGADFLRDITEGDIIVSTKILSGLDKLVLPE